MWTADPESTFKMYIPARGDVQTLLITVAGIGFVSPVLSGMIHRTVSNDNFKMECKFCYHNGVEKFVTLLFHPNSSNPIK
jgi:hypothetical protein